MFLIRFKLYSWVLVVLTWISLSVQAETGREVIEKHFSRLELEAVYRNLDLEADPYFKAYYHHHYHFLRALIHQDPKTWSQFQTHTQHAMGYVESLKENPYKKYVLAEFYFERAALELFRKQFTAGSMLLKKSYNLVSQNRKQYPDLVCNQKLIGIFEIAMSAAPRNYKWILDLLGYKGDFLEGYKKLNLAANKSEILRSECHVLLFFIEKNMMADPWQCKLRLDSLLAIQPDQPFLLYLRAVNAMDRKKNQECIELLQKNETFAKNFPFLYYQLAKSYFFALEWKLAKQYFEQFLFVYTGTHFRLDARFKFAICEAMGENPYDAIPLFQQIAQSEPTTLDEDLHAWKLSKVFSSRILTPNEKILYQSRNLFDGGYYTRSAELLNPFLAKPLELSHDERTEVYYRLGRIYLDQGHFASARLYLTLCLQQNPTQKLWMKVYATFYLGQLHEKMQDWHSARRMFREALQYDGYEYQNG
ncbi:MAG: tetratricopeptide repeat protein, partial [Bacteroidia bacterium]|nr:tetratricopeptide repeat protein [Bacteroidia bacterium]